MPYNHVTHYDPFLPSHDPCGEDSSEYGICGTYLFDGNSTNDKKMVSCKKCIKKFEVADQERESAIQANCDDMQGFMDYISNRGFTEISRLDVLELKYPEVKRVGILYLSGNKGNYYESYYNRNVVCFDIKEYLLFDTVELLYNWLLVKT